MISSLQMPIRIFESIHYTVHGICNDEIIDKKLLFLFNLILNIRLLAPL